MRMWRFPARVVAAVVATLLASQAAAWAQEPPPTPPPPSPPRTEPPKEEPLPPPIPPRETVPEPKPSRPDADADPASPGFLGIVLGDQSEQLQVGDERMFAAVGTASQPIWIKLPGIELRCESLVLWGDRERVDRAVGRHKEFAGRNPDEFLGPVIHACYAEGNVYFRHEKQVVRADRLFVDFEHGRAYFVRAQMSAPISGDHPIALTIRADVIRATARNSYRAENAELTTCNYADPHYEFTTATIDVHYGHEESSFTTAWWPTLRMDTVFADDTPIFVFPKLGGDTGVSSVPVQSVTLSHGTRVGTAVGIAWGGAIRRDDTTKWGEWRLHTDERTRRGPGVGIDLSHESLPSRPGGPVDTIDFSGYLQRDSHGYDFFSDRAYDGGKDRTLTDRNRGYVHLFDRWFVGDTGWRVDNEVAYHSDRGYLPEFQSDKTDREKQEETYVQGRRTWGNEGVSVLASYRLNDEAAALTRRPTDLVLTDYENQTQYLPSVTYHMIDEPILAPLATGLPPLDLSLQASVANVERRYDDRLADRIERDTGWQSESVRRGDLETRLSAPFSLGDVYVSPAVGGSLMGVDEANGFARQDAGSDGRWSAFGDLRVGTQAWKVYPCVSSSLLDLEAMRHVASLELQYFDRFEVSDEPFTFQENDLVDDLAKARIGSVRFRNRLQTKRDGEVVDWMDVESRYLHYFDPSPRLAGSPFGLREDFPEPLQRLDFPGQDKYDAYPREGPGFWQERARMQLTRTIWLSGETDYDLERRFFETTEAGVRWFASERASFYLGRRTIHGDSSILTMRMDYRLSNRWGVSLEHQEDVKSERGLKTVASLFRRAHDYTIAVELRADSQNDDRGVSLAIYPNDWLGSHQDPFSLRRPLDYAAMKWYR